MSLKTVAAVLLATLALVIVFAVSTGLAIWLQNKRLATVELVLKGDRTDFDNRKSLTQQAEETTLALKQLQNSSAVLEHATGEYLEMSRRTLEVVESVAGIQRDRGNRIKRLEDKSDTKHKSQDKEIADIKSRLAGVEKLVYSQVKEEAKKGGKRSLLRLNK